MLHVTVVVGASPFCATSMAYLSDSSFPGMFECPGIDLTITVLFSGCSFFNTSITLDCLLSMALIKDWLFVQMTVSVEIDLVFSSSSQRHVPRRSYR